MKFHHIGIIVNNLKNYKSNFKYLLNAKKFSKKFIDKVWNVEIIFVTSKEGILYELISPLNNKSIILNQIKNKSNIINHLAFKTKDIKKEKKRLVNIGALPITEPKSAIAFKGKKVQFFYTKHNFIYEIIEE